MDQTAVESRRRRHKKPGHDPGVLGAARLTEPIPMAVLAGIALKVGIDILDWSFLKRSHDRTKYPSRVPRSCMGCCS
uniref:hypothetical protein n=1 Tax=Coleofasciculus sp. FACHB-SPT9 TaxID=2692791 RepID=UPI0030DA5950